MVAAKTTRSPTSALSQLRRGVLEHCVLALLRDGERYGGDLIHTLDKTDRLATSQGTLYPLLARLRREGLVQSEQRLSPFGPARRYYRLTPEGVAALDDFALEWAGFASTVDQLLERSTV